MSQSAVVEVLFQLIRNERNEFQGFQITAPEENEGAKKFCEKFPEMATRRWTSMYMQDRMLILEERNTGMRAQIALSERNKNLIEGLLKCEVKIAKINGKPPRFQVIL